MNKHLKNIVKGTENKWKSTWILASQIAAWIAGIISCFVLPPILGTPDSEKTVWQLSQFLTTLLVIGLVVLSGFFSQSKYLVYWLALFLISLAVSLWAYDRYDSVRHTCTCVFREETKLIGTILKDPVRDENRTCERLLKSSGGNASKIWTEASINRCRKSMMWLYLVTVPLFTLAMISILQVVGIAVKKNKSKHPYKNNSG